MTKRRPTGVYRWKRAINRCPLDKSEKLVLHTMLEWAHHATGECYPAVGTIAEAAAMTPGGTRKVIRQLQRRGVLTVLSQSRGGYNAKGRGITNHYRLELRVLETMNPNPDEGCSDDDPSQGFAPPESTMSTPPHQDSYPPSPGCDKHTNEQTSEHTTTTTTPDGGGGGVVASDGEADADEADECDGVTELIGFGIMATKARALRAAHVARYGADSRPDFRDVVLAGMKHVQTAGRGARNPQGLLVSLIDDGTCYQHAEEAHEKRVWSERQNAERAEKERKEQARQAAVQAMKTAWNTVHEQASTRGPEWTRRLPAMRREIEKAFATWEQALDAGVLEGSESLLGDPVANCGEIVNLVYQAARRRLKAEQTPSQSRAVETGCA